jgi:glycosyltransferase involved in cell wall biosynthesis
MKLDRKKILHVVNIYFVLPFFIGDQFKHFARKGYTLFAACSQSDYLPQFARDNGFSYIETPVRRSLSIGDDLRSIRNVYRYIRQNRIGIVEGHTPKGGLIAMVAAWLARVPIRIYFRHGIVYETSHGLKRAILMNVDRLTSALATKVVCVSPSVMKRSLEDHLCPSGKMTILSKGTCNGIDTQGKFNPENIDAQKLQTMREKWGLKPGDWVLGYTGRLVRDKGIIELVKAFKQLKAKEPRDTEHPLKLLLVGMFEKRDALPADIHRMIVEDKDIVWTDFQNSDMEYFYSMMNVYVLPSYREGFPTGVLEALSMGVPVITTTSTGCIDAIVEGQTGLRTTIDADEVARQVARIHDEQLDKKWKTAARQWVVENFDEKIIWEEIEKLYH